MSKESTNSQKLAIEWFKSAYQVQFDSDTLVRILFGLKRIHSMEDLEAVMALLNLEITEVLEDECLFNISPRLNLNMPVKSLTKAQVPVSDGLADCLIINVV